MSGPSVAFLVLAHRGPEQLGRLVRRLLAPGTEVHLHVDGRTAPKLHAAIVAALPADERVHLLERIPTPWAGWGAVQARLRGLAAILDGPAPPEHIAVLSGQDYPLRPAGDIATFLAEYPGRTFAPSWPMPAELYGPDGGMFRIRYWHTPVRRRRVHIPIRRRFPAGVAPYGGSAFMVVDRETARAVLEFTRSRPDVERFHRHVWAVDEHFIPTALHNSPRASAVIDENVWHMEWTPGAAHPHTFTDADFDRLADAARHSSDGGGEARVKLFARKFDADGATRLLDRIDAELLGVNA
jgi:hypothetical protein